MKHRNKKVKRQVSIAKPLPVALCQSLEDLSYSGFIKCALNGDYSPLIRSGNPSKNELYQAWMRLYSDYLSLIGSKETAAYIKIVSKIENVNTKIFIVSGIIEALHGLYSEKLCNELKSWGFNKEFSRDTLSADLEQVERELGNDRFQLEKYRLEYEKSEKAKKKSGEATTKTGYMRILYAIEAHRKMDYDPDTISMYKFCILYKELEEYNIQLTSKNKTNGGR